MARCTEKARGDRRDGFGRAGAQVTWIAGAESYDDDPAGCHVEEPGVLGGTTWVPFQLP